MEDRSIIDLSTYYSHGCHQSRIDGYWFLPDEDAKSLNVGDGDCIIDPGGRLCRIETTYTYNAIGNLTASCRLIPQPMPKTMNPCAEIDLDTFEEAYCDDIINETPSIEGDLEPENKINKKLLLLNV